MATKTYTISEAKAQLSDIIRRVKLGERITIGAARRPEVSLVLFQPAKRERKFGTLQGQVQMSEDFCATDPEIEKLFGG